MINSDFSVFNVSSGFVSLNVGHRRADSVLETDLTTLLIGKVRPQQEGNAGLLLFLRSFPSVPD